MKSIKGKAFIFLITVLIFSVSCSHKIIPAEPNPGVMEYNPGSLPPSDINVSAQISLKPLFSFIEKNIDTVYTSTGYPDAWEYEGCSIRYKYTFRRGPLQMKASGNILNMSFTGYYKVIGSTRACINGTAISPWTPPCKCGFDEGERKVNVSFEIGFIIQPDYKVSLSIKRLEPQPLNKCEVCFWGQDITKQVMDELKFDLDEAKRNIEHTYGVFDLRSKFQQAWDKLNEPYNVYGLGWLQANPEKLRINSLFASNDTLNVYLGLSAKPVISFEKPSIKSGVIPNISGYSSAPGFNIFLDAVLQYDSLSAILNQQLEGHVLDLGKGPVKNKFVISSCRLFGADHDKLIFKLDFTGSAEGTAYLTGKPAYDQATHIIEIKELDFDVKTRDKFLKTASWLFNKKITEEISSHTKFDLSSFIDSTKFMLMQQLNKVWMPGVKTFGFVSNIDLEGIYPMGQFLVIRIQCKGLLTMQVNTSYLNFSDIIR